MLDDVKNYFADFDGATNVCRTVALWITVALVAAFIITKIYVFALNKRARTCDGTIAAQANKIVNGAWIVIALFVSLCFIAAFSACYFTDVAHGEDVLVPILFYPMLVFAIVVFGCAVTLFIKPDKITKITSACLCAAAFTATLGCMIAYYASGDAVENNGADVLSSVGLYVSSAVVVAAVVALAFFADRNKTPFDTKTITFAAVCVALSFALSYVRLFKMPMGGSITFASMLPLMLFAYMFGSRKGVLTGLVYGVLQAIQDAWIIHPAQFILDYGVAFAALGVAGCIREFGLFKKNMRAQFALGACVACAFRFVCHYFSGVFAFGMYGADFAVEYGMPALANEYFYSFVYQSLYLIPELAIVIAVGMLVFASGNFRKQILRYVNRTAALERGAANNADVADTASLDANTSVETAPQAAADADNISD